MPSYLLIENPGVCPTEGFILFGATSKHYRDETNPFTIGQFGSGNKHAAGVLLRNGLAPIVFCGTEKLEFFTKAGKMRAVDGDSSYERICVKHGGRSNETGASVTFTDETSQTTNYGYMDWDSVAMGLREYVSNAIDAAIAVNESKWAEEGHGGLKYPWDGVKVEIVDENRVRAKSGHTRVFVPLTNERLGEGQAVILNFYNALGKWFLHFSEPWMIQKSILPKKNRNMGEKATAVIYRRGVRVREIQGYENEALFDYNLNNLRMDESRNVDDYVCRCEAAKEMSKAGVEQLAILFRSFMASGDDRWEWGFGQYELRPTWGETPEQVAAKTAAWGMALEQLGENAVLTPKDTPTDTLRHKGYRPVEAPEAFVRAAAAYGVRTPDKVLSEDERNGREIVDATPSAINAVNWVWARIIRAGMDGGKECPPVKCFRSVMNAGSIRMGFYREGVVYLSLDFADGASVELRQTALEEVAHFVTGVTDSSRDFQDFAFKLATRLEMVAAGEIPSLGYTSPGLV